MHSRAQPICLTEAPWQLQSSVPQGTSNLTSPLRTKFGACIVAWTSQPLLGGNHHILVFAHLTHPLSQFASLANPRVCGEPALGHQFGEPPSDFAKLANTQV